MVTKSFITRAQPSKKWQHRIHPQYINQCFISFRKLYWNMPSLIPQPVSENLHRKRGQGWVGSVGSELNWGTRFYTFNDSNSIFFSIIIFRFSFWLLYRFFYQGIRRKAFSEISMKFSYLLLFYSILFLPNADRIASHVLRTIRRSIIKLIFIVSEIN